VYVYHTSKGRKVKIEKGKAIFLDDEEEEEEVQAPVASR